jgi:hypothetical protein
MRKSSVLLGIATVACALSAGWFWQQMRDQRQRAERLELRLAALETSRAAMTTASATAPTSGPNPTPPASAAPTATSTPAVATSTPPRVAGKQEDWEAYQRRMMRDPRYREVQREQTRLALAPRRANLIRLLGMTPAQADAVIDMQIEHEWQQSEQMNNLATEEQRQQQQRADAQEADYQAKLREMLGGDKHLRLQHYMETRQTRMQVDTFRTHLNGMDSLRDDQVEPLIEALHVERQKMQDELDQFGESLRREGESNDSWQRYGERQIELMKDMHAGMHVSAAAILSSSQLDQLDAMLNRELQRHETNMRMSKLQSKLDSAAGAAPPAN